MILIRKGFVCGTTWIQNCSDGKVPLGSLLGEGVSAKNIS